MVLYYCQKCKKNVNAKIEKCKREDTHPPHELKISCPKNHHMGILNTCFGN